MTDQPHVPQTSRPGAVAIAIMVEHRGPFRMQKRNGQRKTVSRGEGIGGLQVDRVDPIARHDFLAGFPNVVSDVTIFRLQEAVMHRCFPLSSLQNPQSFRRQVRRHKAGRHASLRKQFLFGCKQSAEDCQNESADSGMITHAVLHLAVFVNAVKGG